MYSLLFVELQETLLVKSSMICCNDCMFFKVFVSTRVFNVDVFNSCVNYVKRNVLAQLFDSCMHI